MALENVDSKDMPTYNIFVLYLCFDTFKFIINLNYIGFHIMLTKSTGLFHYDADSKNKFNDSNKKFFLWLVRDSLRNIWIINKVFAVSLLKAKWSLAMMTI